MLTRLRFLLCGVVIGGGLIMTIHETTGGWPLLILACLELWRLCEEAG